MTLGRLQATPQPVVQVHQPRALTRTLLSRTTLSRTPGPSRRSLTDIGTKNPDVVSVPEVSWLEC